MDSRKIDGTEVAEIGLGCMNLSHAYGTPLTKPEATRLLHQAIDLGVTHFDTAALYGFGRNEELVGEALKPVRGSIHLASKCGMTGVDGKRVIDGRPETLKKTCERALKRLQTEVIDLYYLHRWDKSVPIEESVGAMGQLVTEGKIRAIGLSEVSAPTLRRAHAVHPIAAVQTEYSLCSRNAEVAVLDACREIGAAFVAFSPLARGLLAGLKDDACRLVEGDIRRNMPRFQEPNFSRNRRLMSAFSALATALDCTPSQLALAWLLHKGTHIIPIPGTTNVNHLKQNLGAASIRIPADISERLEALLPPSAMYGNRYPPAAIAEIDTEEASARDAQ